jgi:hypothetical protein
MSGLPEDRVKVGLGVALASEVVSAVGLFAVMEPPKQAKPERASMVKKRRKPARRGAKVIPFARAVNDN